MKDADPMEEAYKKLDGEPSAEAVSDVAKGGEPTTDFKQFRMNTEERIARFNGGRGEIDNAYANLFQSLADILRKNC